MRVLMHVCCGPDATIALERRDSDQQMTLFFDNPNIYPTEEYARRQVAFLKVACHFQAEYLIGDYSPEVWNDWILGSENDPEGGARCSLCIGHRLERTAVIASAQGFDAIGAVFTTSPHKRSQVINELGKRAAENHDIQYIPADYKKKDGFKRSVQLSRELGIYRQNYCGCRFSLPRGIHGA